MALNPVHAGLHAAYPRARGSHPLPANLHGVQDRQHCHSHWLSRGTLATPITLKLAQKRRSTKPLRAESHLQPQATPRRRACRRRQSRGKQGAAKGELAWQSGGSGGQVGGRQAEAASGGRPGMHALHGRRPTRGTAGQQSALPAAAAEKGKGGCASAGSSVAMPGANRQATAGTYNTAG